MARVAEQPNSTQAQQASITVVITPARNSPAGKLADAVVHFHDGVMAGLKLEGFAVWARRDGSGRNVTVPSRTYSVNGERRSFALLRATDNPEALQPLRDLILAAYAETEGRS